MKTKLKNDDGDVGHILRRETDSIAKVAIHWTPEAKRREADLKNLCSRQKTRGKSRSGPGMGKNGKNFFAALCAKRRYGHKTKADRCVTSFPSVRRKSSKRWNCKSSAVGVTYCKSAMGAKFCHGHPKKSDLVDGFLSISKFLIHSPSPFPAI